MLLRVFMSHWSNGYLTKIDYINHYDAKMNLNYLTVPFLMNNLAPPKIKTCCELGFGQGRNIVVQGLTTTTEWYGTDFLPSQVLKARQLNELAGKNRAGQTQLFDQSFEEFCLRDDLPDFDLIVFHGIWSWISDENRQIILDFIRRKLKVGGVVYASYNMLPAWSQILPLKHLLTTQYRLTPTSVSTEERVGQAISKVDELVASSPSFEKNNPVLMTALKSINQKPAAYVAHEYLNEELKPMYFDEIANLFDQAKLTFACSVDYFNDADEYTLSEEQRSFLQDIDDPILRQAQKDTMLMRWFRQDYWVKGVDKLSDDETLEYWRQVRVLLTTEHEKVNPIYNNGFGDITIGQGLFQAILNILKDYQIHTIDEIIDVLSDEHHHKKVIQAIALLMSRHDVEIVQSNESIEAVKQRCSEFNRVVLDNIFNPSIVKFLISPVSSQLVKLSNVNLLLVKAISEKISPDKQAEWVWQYMQKHRQSFSGQNQQNLSKEETVQLLNDAINSNKSLQKIVRALKLI